MKWRSDVGLFTAALVFAVTAACTAQSDDPPRPAEATVLLPPLADPVETPTESLGFEEPEPGPTVPTQSSEHGSESDDRHMRSGAVMAGDDSFPEEPPLADPESQEAGVPPPGAAAPDPDAARTGTEATVVTTTASTAPASMPDAAGVSPESAAGGPVLLNNIQVSGSYRPDMSVRVDDGVIEAIVTGTAGSRPQVYALAALAGQKLEAALLAPSGVGLEIHHEDEVLYSGHDGSGRLETTLDHGGDLLLRVSSSGEEPGGYVLTIRIGPPDPEPVQSSPPTRTASRSRIQQGDVVYLTFDDGPNPNHTPEVLDILARHGARATFFVIGSLVERYPAIFQRIVAEGHTVANHTWRHENLARLTKAEFDETISRTEEILGPHATPCLRPPYAATGSHTREWAAEYGLAVHLWTVSANDWLGLNATEIADRIESRVTAGSVVLMHDGGGNRTQTVRGLEMLLDRLADLDLRYEPLCV